MQKRTFLKTLAAAGLGAASTRLLAGGPPDTKFLFVFLRGGYDGASLVIPTSSTLYYEKRPRIAIPRPGSGTDKQAAAVALDADFGLHPAVAPILMPYCDKGQLVFLPFSGSQDVSRSHFEAQDVVELGQPAGPGTKQDMNSGMLNRLVEVLSRNGGRGGISFTDNLALAFKGGSAIPNLSLKGNVRGNAEDAPTKLAASLYQNQKLGVLVTEGLETRKRATVEIETAMVGAKDAPTASSFEKEARRVGILMKSNPAYSVGFVDVGGWDTHVNQGSSTGLLANTLTTLAQGLATFADTMGPMWANTVVVVMSEFGRTFQENGTGGTDHGYGNTLWVMGGGLRGGRLAGERTLLAANTLHDGRELPVLNDYREVLGNIFTRVYGLSSKDLQHVLPGVRSHDFHLI